jgi:hypothetical protein
MRCLVAVWVHDPRSNSYNKILGKCDFPSVTDDTTVLRKVLPPSLKPSRWRVGWPDATTRYRFEVIDPYRFEPDAYFDSYEAALARAREWTIGIEAYESEANLRRLVRERPFPGHSQHLFASQNPASTEKAQSRKIMPRLEWYTHDIINQEQIISIRPDRSNLREQTVILSVGDSGLVNAELSAAARKGDGSMFPEDKQRILRKFYTSARASSIAA